MIEILQVSLADASIWDMFLALVILAFFTTLVRAFIK